MTKNCREVSVRTGIVDQYGARDVTRAAALFKRPFNHVVRRRRARCVFFTLAVPTILLILSVIGGYEPSTPYQPSKKRKPSASRPTAGPSTAKAQATRQRNPSSEAPMVVEDDELDDEEPSVAKPPSSTKKGKTRAGSSFLMEEGEVVEETRSASSPELERMREERDLVRPLPAPQYNCGKTIEHCCTVQSQERGTVRKHASANKGKKYGTRRRANSHESAI